jgi:hypothetical protein
MAAIMQQAAAMSATMINIFIMVNPPLDKLNQNAGRTIVLFAFSQTLTAKPRPTAPVFQRRCCAGCSLPKPSVSIRVFSNPRIGFTRFKSLVFKMDNPTL